MQFLSRLGQPTHDGRMSASEHEFYWHSQEDLKIQETARDRHYARGCHGNMSYDIVVAGNVFNSCSVYCTQGIQCSGIGCPGHSTVIRGHPCLTQCVCIVSCITIKRNEMTFVRQHLHTPGLSTTAPKHSRNAFKIESPI